jgi:inosine-uridine nucleoside N-ribohydrolase
LNVVGIVSAHVPGYVDSARDTALRTAETVALLPPIRRPEIVPGSNVALSPNISAHPTRELAGARYILSRSASYDPSNRLTVLIIGPATDVGLAYLLDNSVANRIRVVALAFDKPGQPSGGWNADADPKAWEILISSAAPLVIATESVAKRDLMFSLPNARELLASKGSLGKYLYGLLSTWVRNYPEVVKATTGRTDSWPIWDLAAVAALLGFAECDSRLSQLRRPTPPRANMCWIKQVSTRELRTHFVRNITP